MRTTSSLLRSTRSLAHTRARLEGTAGHRTSLRVAVVEMQRRWWVGVVAAGILVAMGSIPRGHTPIASRWNFNEHFYLVFKDRCGSCHVEGGVAPMSLIDYQSALPWAQSIREEVLGLRMPPWQAEDGFGDFKNGRALTANRDGHDPRMVVRWLPVGSSGSGPGQGEPQRGVDPWRTRSRARRPGGLHPRP